MPEAVSVSAGVDARNVQIDLQIAAGEVVALIGPNGAGKSTCIQLVAGALRPDNGSVTIGGRTMADKQVFLPAHRRRVGYLEQRPLLFPHFSVLDNVAFGPRARGASRAASRERARAELAAVDLEGFEQRAPRELSGGQAQRVAIARALAFDPDVVLLDEPFAALDASATPGLRRVLHDRLSDVTTLLVTHDPLDVLSLADRVVYIEAGRVENSGAVEDVFHRPDAPFLADFVGLNLLFGAVNDDGSISVSDEIRVSGIANARLTTGHARAVFPPDAVSLFRFPPGGSPRNELPARVVGVEDRGLVQRVSLTVAGQHVSADVTPAAVRDLRLADGGAVVAVVKATQVALYPTV